MYVPAYFQYILLAKRLPGFLPSCQSVNVPMNQMHAAYFVLMLCSQLCLNTVHWTQFTRSLSSIFSIKTMGYIFLLCGNVDHFYIPNFSFYLIILNLKNEVECLFNFYDVYVGNETASFKRHLFCSLILIGLFDHLYMSQFYLSFKT